MNALMNSIIETSDNQIMNSSISQAISGEMFKIEDGFSALAFRDKNFSGTMDPLVMVDHYTMTKPTFGAHPHAGLSAVSVIFEDSEGLFHNRDSLGNDFDIMPGDLYWLKAGSGAIHDESPREGSTIHGLQVFVNLPSDQRMSTPKSLHVKAENMPHIECEGSRVRVVLGQSNGIVGEQSPALPMTILDGKINSNKTFSHQLQIGENAWFYVVKGELLVLIDGKHVRLSSGQAVSVSEVSSDTELVMHVVNPCAEQAHFALFAGKPVNEPYIQKGPFLMGSETEIAQIESDYSAGKLGKLV
ncbi:pirin-like C-terminal cupin domain-containing protein [Alteromonas sp. ASW11-36]|uniref:Pirin-like C-terminal cupin domain-containing protein n=1 Tax=Alteromonas arenosi TaxID=3055817 RepID=A0ABT7SY82_9ALTE|nr:pirin-like C-terminal cupin domain-containing protein [Alteromonas sp. ASW11-36]MDM7861146.1 pirin-like C-terminal cupin domain-containing protein [Alteromonas sp. ASW11-36]